MISTGNTYETRSESFRTISWSYFTGLTALLGRVGSTLLLGLYAFAGGDSPTGNSLRRLFFFKSSVGEFSFISSTTVNLRHFNDDDFSFGNTEFNVNTLLVNISHRTNTRDSITLNARYQR